MRVRDAFFSISFICPAGAAVAVPTRGTFIARRRRHLVVGLQFVGVHVFAAIIHRLTSGSRTAGQGCDPSCRLGLSSDRRQSPLRQTAGSHPS
jgi:hypothetical protein